MSVPFYLAPMAEISHRAFRELIEDFGGCDAYFSEMISAGALFSGGPYEKWYIDAAPKPEKVVFQVVGSDIGQISNAVTLLDRLECAGIDINMGCSAPLIRKTGAGAAWMASIDRSGELISHIRPLIKRRLSVKLRVGYKDDFDYLVRFCRRLEAEGVELITLHPRLVKEKFKRLARWEYVGRLKQELKIPVAGNGDISSPEEIVRRATDGSCDAVMIGRAAARHPWIFAKARKLEGANYVPKGTLSQNVTSVSGEALPPNLSSVPGDAMPIGLSSVPNIEEIGLRFLELLSQYQPHDFHFSRAMRFFGFFCDNLKWGNYLKTQLNREKTLSGIEMVWKGYFKMNEE
ncbi:dihydrouridine synthase [Treponema sp. R8-4-B8]